MILNLIKHKSDTNSLMQSLNIISSISLLTFSSFDINKAFEPISTNPASFNKKSDDFNRFDKKSTIYSVGVISNITENKIIAVFLIETSGSRSDNSILINSRGFISIVSKSN